MLLVYGCHKVVKLSDFIEDQTLKPRILMNGPPLDHSASDVNRCWDSPALTI